MALIEYPILIRISNASNGMKASRSRMPVAKKITMATSVENS